MPPVRPRNIRRGASPLPVSSETTPQSSNSASSSRRDPLPRNNHGLYDALLQVSRASRTVSDLRSNDRYPATYNLNNNLATEQESRTDTNGPMFGSGSKLMITGGQTIFQQHTHYHRGSDTDGIEMLYQNSSPSAAYNSKDRDKAPKCYSNTRIGLLEIIRNWAKDGPSLIMWLYGSAGVGKSTVVQTISEEFEAQSNLAASFFFSRTANPSRHLGDEERFVATIVYQLIQVIPALSEYVDAIVYHDPSVFDLTLSQQVMTLIMEPLKTLKTNNGDEFIPTTCPQIIVVDGLDECRNESGQNQVLEAIAILVGHPDVFPFSVFLSSRPGAGIKSWFGNAESKNPALIRSVSMSDVCDNDHDIEVFVRHEAAEIRQTHPFKLRIPPSWPSEDLVKEIVKRACGQFVFASTIMKDARDIRDYPNRRLEAILHEHREAHRPNELDALYLRVLRQTKHPDFVRYLLSVEIILGSFIGTTFAAEPQTYLEPLLGLPDPIDTYLVDLQLIIAHNTDGTKCGDNPHTMGDSINSNRSPLGMPILTGFYQASFKEFLLSPKRSQEFYIDVQQADSELCYTTLQHIRHLRTRADTVNEEYIIYCFIVLLQTEASHQPEFINRIWAELDKWDQTHQCMLYDIFHILSSKLFQRWGEANSLPGVKQALLKTFAPAITRKRYQLKQELKDANLSGYMLAFFEHGLLQSVGRELPETASFLQLLTWRTFEAFQTSSGADAWKFFSDPLPRSLQRYQYKDWVKYMGVLSNELCAEDKETLSIKWLFSDVLSDNYTAALAFMGDITRLLFQGWDDNQPMGVRAVFDHLKSNEGDGWREVTAAALLSNLSKFVWEHCPLRKKVIFGLTMFCRMFFPLSVVYDLEGATFPDDSPYPASEVHALCSLPSDANLVVMPRWFLTHHLTTTTCSDDPPQYDLKMQSLGYFYDYIRLYMIRSKATFSLDCLDGDCNDGECTCDRVKISIVPLADPNDNNDINTMEDHEGDGGGSDAMDDHDNGDEEDWMVACDLSVMTIDPETDRFIDLGNWSLGMKIDKFIHEYGESFKVEKDNDAGQGMELDEETTS